MPCCGRKPKKGRVKYGRPFLMRHIKGNKVKAMDAKPPVKTFLMCRPKHYGINYSINPWMNVGNQANRELATRQWETLRDQIVAAGGEVVYAKERESLPDMVFTANAGLVLKDKFILSNFRHPERKPEEWWFRQFFVDRKIPVYTTNNLFEGAGDALIMGESLICGYGFRSELAVYKEIAAVWDNTVLVELADPCFYHLDTCFCPLDECYLIYPDAFKSESLEAIRALGWKELAVPKEEARRFACNAVQVGKVVVLPDACPVTEQLLRDNGYTPVSVGMSEFIKSGGACKCLTLAL